MSSRDAVRLSCESPLTALKGIGPVRAERMESAGFHNVGELLHLLPIRYEDRRRVSRLEDVREEGQYTLTGWLEDLRPLRISRRRLTLVRGRLVSGEQSLRVVWFNRPYLSSQVESKVEYVLHGAVRRRADRWELVNPSVEPVERARLAGRVVPIYPSAGLTPAELRRFISSAIDGLDSEQTAEPIPFGLRERHGLPCLGPALEYLHRPPPEADVDALNAHSTAQHRRLAYGEMLCLQLQLALRRRRVLQSRKTHRYDLGPELQDMLESRLPFTLTDAQRRSLDEILRDLDAPYPMMRLLQGDVGCGKTAVAALALAAAAESGLQGALMAPTEILAEQHYDGVRRLLGERYPIVLLTSSAASRSESRRRLESGKVSLAIGTHALIQEQVRFSRLGLVVIDEQHRFGVEQRRRLQLKGDHPDLLVMTATPIPRSLTLTVYGDLSLSVIDELPPGRSAVATRVVPREQREEIYVWLEKELATGASAYIVLPFIDESPAVDAESISGFGRELQIRFERYRPLILHGRASSDERAATMTAFSSGDAKVLLATTLIEVGVDVPDASIMIIERAERFGLAQLHQLRGRVGRGQKRSDCVAIHGELAAEGRQRLDVFAGSSDGFRIAEADLEIRGPGDVLGTLQAGLPAFRVADLVRDRALIEKARVDAREMVESDEAQARRLAFALGATTAGSDFLAGA